MLRAVFERPGRPLRRGGVSSTWTLLGGLRVHARLIDSAAACAADVVLVHGLGVSSRYMLPLARDLAPHFRVHAPDLPGFGHSDHPPAPLDVPGLAAALVEWVEAIGLTAPALVGNSMGCQIVVEALRRRPELFPRAVLQGPTFDRRGRNAISQTARLLRTGLRERPGLNLVLLRDYLDCGLGKVRRTARAALAHPLEDGLAEITVPVLVVRGGADAVVPQRWAEEVADALPDGRLAVLPRRGHALNYSAPGRLAAAVLPFLGGPSPGPDAPTTRAAGSSIAGFDSATAVLRGTASALRGRDLPALGVVPRPVAPLLERVLPVVNALPARVREEVYRRGSGAEAVRPGELWTVSADAVARWMVDQYARRPYPAAIIGSSSGALAHLAAALDAPFLPQTFLVPVAQPQVHPDDPRGGLAAGLGPGRLLLDANPHVALHHMHDPNQDRLSLARMTYFRLKHRTLPAAFAEFLSDSLPRGATLVVAHCGLRWPVTRLGSRHVFQFGALGGMPPEEFHRGGPRVAEYLRRYGSSQDRWDPPASDDEAPEAEWGLDPAILADLEVLAARRGWRVRLLAFDRPEDVSPLVAELYRWWYRRAGLPDDRLLVESFVLLDPRLALTTGSVPYWSTFPVDASAEAIERYLDTTEPYDEIHLTLFSHGTDGVGVTPIDRWRTLLTRARRHGAFLGVAPARYPRDFGSFGRFHGELSNLSSRPSPPQPLTLPELETFLAGGIHSSAPVAWQ
jgi:pimeloyl-ACP methyl ester carboxylesterase